MSAETLPSWTVLRFMGSDRYEILAHALKAETREQAALKTFENHRRKDDAEAWAMMVLSEEERGNAAVEVRLRAEITKRSAA